VNTFDWVLVTIIVAACLLKVFAEPINALMERIFES
jgi:hypothetical protein